MQSFGMGHETSGKPLFAALKFDDVDMVLDFLADEDIIPIIDLGDKPKHTLRDFDQVIYMEPRKKVYETLDEYKKVLEMFMSHVIRRYGEAWVNQWIFDVWFDPGEAYQNSVVIRMEDYDYTEVFEATAKIIKSFGKNIRVAAPDLSSEICTVRSSISLKNIKIFPTRQIFYPLTGSPMDILMKMMSWVLLLALIQSLFPEKGSVINLL